MTSTFRALTCAARIAQRTDITPGRGPGSGTVPAISSWHSSCPAQWHGTCYEFLAQFLFARVAQFLPSSEWHDSCLAVASASAIAIAIAVAGAGAIHVNGNLTLGMDGGQKLGLRNFVTCSSNIYVSMGAGNIEINLPDGTYHTMEEGGDVIDCNNNSWKALAIQTWQGRVKSRVHGVPIMKLPIPFVADNPRILIEPQTNMSENANISKSRYYNRAAIRIINGVVEKYNPVTSNFVYAARIGDGNNFLTTNTVFYNIVISNYVRPLNIDIGNFVTWANANAAASFCNDAQRAGLVYVYNTNNQQVRLTNADTLPSSVVNGVTNGFTFATGNALYTQGHVNWPANPDLAVPASMISDSMTILSEDWTDAAHNDPSDGITKVNSPIHVWTSVVTGQSTNRVDGTTFFGGVEDLPKYIEDFVGTGVSAKKDIRGSIVSLWNSRSELLNTFSSTIDPANRLWTYDPDFAYSVGTPRFYEFVTKEWKRVAGRSEAVTGAY